MNFSQLHSDAVDELMPTSTGNRRINVIISQLSDVEYISHSLPSTDISIGA